MFLGSYNMVIFFIPLFVCLDKQVDISMDIQGLNIVIDKLHCIWSTRGVGVIGNR